ncbi:MAG: hypothetical protein K2X47_10140 [Bdellovibrionales bacterium]|nr:hypothetical protein [Bdellovibrionales bacterium]
MQKAVFLFLLIQVLSPIAWSFQQPAPCPERYQQASKSNASVGEAFQAFEDMMDDFDYPSTANLVLHFRQSEKLGPWTGSGEDPLNVFLVKLFRAEVGQDFERSAFCTGKPWTLKQLKDWMVQKGSKVWSAQKSGRSH